MLSSFTLYRFTGIKQRSSSLAACDLFLCSSYEHATWCQNRDFSFQNNRLEYLVKLNSDLIRYGRHRRRIAAGLSTSSTSPASTSTTSLTFTRSSSGYSVNDPLTVQTRVERESCSQLETLQASVDELCNRLAPSNPNK